MVQDNRITQRNKKQEKVVKTNQVAVPSDEEALSIPEGEHYRMFFDFQNAVQNEVELINKYIAISTMPDVYRAIEEITSEAIAAIDSEPPIILDTDGLDYSDKFKKRLVEEFDIALRLLDFKNKSHDIFRLWYICGKIGYQIVLNKDTEKGIAKLVFMDPRKFKKIRVVKKKRINDTGIEIVEKTEEYYVYNDKGIFYSTGVYSASQFNTNKQTITLPIESVAYASSGLFDLDKGLNLSYLHPALKPANQLSMLKDAVVIARIVRAPLRRMFNVYVGELSKNKADQYMRSVISKYKNKVTYDTVDGTIKDARQFMSVLEDYWFPRDAAGQGHSVENLEGQRNLGDIEDVKDIQEDLNLALNIPPSRLKDQTILFGRQAEISRDELKFAKFVNRLRRKFNNLFDDILKTNLICKKIIRPEDWDEIKEKINYKYTQDLYFLEIKEGEILRNRIDLVNQVAPYVGIYFSKQYVNKKILRLTEQEMMDMEQQITDELPSPEEQEEEAMQQGQDDKEAAGHGPQVGTVQAAALTRAITQTRRYHQSSLPSSEA